MRPGHRLQLLKGAAAFFDALIREVDGARAEVLLETYILELSGGVIAVAEALERAARRGVKVRMVVDGVGTPAVAAEWQARWRDAGLEWRTFNPASGWRLLLPARWRRLHRKLCVVDGRVAFCGGINLLDDYEDPNHGALQEPRFDFAVRVEGPLVADVHETMARLWLRMDVASEARSHDFAGALDAVRKAAEAGADMSDAQIARPIEPPEVGADGDGGADEGAAPALDQALRGSGSGRSASSSAGSGSTRAAGRRIAGSGSAGSGDARSVSAGADPTRSSGAAAPPEGVMAALVLRDNLRFRRRIERTYRYAIGQARSEIIIANAYFVPGVTLQRALLRAAKRGVKVTLLLQGRYEYFMQHHTTRALYGPLLDAGIRIIEYRASFLHAKVAVMDSAQVAIATVGSSNLDPLSLLLAREANIFVLDDAFAAELRGHLVDAMSKHSESVETATYLKRPWHARGLSWLAYALMRIALFATRNRY
nr:phospholipase D-like domain-containing protein [Schlegelella koreensis]